jgi:asparagine synthase (glutamine-hydrolysing)
MCGIVAAWGTKAEVDLNPALKMLHHRGPDGRGSKDLPNGALGHTRLAILDVYGGYQPMGRDGTWISFNGEIYNYRALAAEQLADAVFQTRSDTEVILELYRKKGPACTSLLDGMFAFAIIQQDELFLARDPLGIKPLYYGERDGMLYFASEIKALALFTDDVREFPAGHWFHSRQGWYCYYELPNGQLPLSSEQQAMPLIHSTLEAVVQKRLLADVPVGISLSGGLDSSIVALLANAGTNALHTFAVGMEGSEDLAAARRVAEVLGTHHHERVYTDQDMLEALPRILYHLESFDPALARSAIPNYFLAELASQFVKVILTGEGADEIYAGYDYLASFVTAKKLQQEMVNITGSLHNTNLQRADRIPMAFGLEARVPFLDIKSVELGLGLPPEWKFRDDRPAKYLLRESFRGELPDEIVDRPKQKFSRGAGSWDVMRQKAEEEISNQEFFSERARLLYEWDYRLPNKEALLYYRMLKESFRDEWILPTLGQSRSL